MKYKNNKILKIQPQKLPSFNRISPAIKQAYEQLGKTVKNK